jgi:hypothetical protein
MANVNDARFLVSPRADFWLLGGASLVVWAVLTVGHEFDASRAVMAATRTDVSLWVIALFSYPHFAASQWLCYSRGKEFLKQHWFELFAAPTALIAALGWVYCNYESAGMLGLRFFLTAFLLLSGWHFAMQAFGSSLIGFYYDGVKLSREQRRALKASLVVLWLYFFTCRFTTPADRVVYDLEIFSLAMPAWIHLALGVLVLVSAVWAAHLLVVKRWQETGARPSGRAIVPWLSLYVWWLPALRSPEFFLYGIPLFHGLQQYAFTYRFERGRGKGQAKIFFLAFGLVAFGFFLHRMVPVLLDESRFSPRPNYFFLCFTFVINIHHYFLDRANWRLSNPQTRSCLLDVPAAPLGVSHAWALPRPRGQCGGEKLPE